MRNEDDFRRLGYTHNLLQITRCELERVRYFELIENVVVTRYKLRM